MGADESTDISDHAQIMFFICGVHEDLTVTEELTQVEGLLETTRGQHIYQAFLNMITTLDLPLEKLSGLTTDGVLSIIGYKSGFVSLVLPKQKEIKSPISAYIFHCIIHQQAMHSKIANLDQVMKVVVKTVTYIKARGLNHRQFCTLMAELEAECTSVIYH